MKLATADSKTIALNRSVSFDDLLLETVDEILVNIFGRKVLIRILQYMEEKYSLKWQEIPRKNKVFAKALREILDTGSIIVEDLIVETLYLNLGLELKRKKDYTFSEYVEELRKNLGNSNPQVSYA